jgi:hypothetical protein
MTGVNFYGHNRQQIQLFLDGEQLQLYYSISYHSYNQILAHQFNYDT